MSGTKRADFRESKVRIVLIFQVPFSSHLYLRVSGGLHSLLLSTRIKYAFIVSPLHTSHLTGTLIM
jgi:hypothetical protein